MKRDQLLELVVHELGMPIPEAKRLSVKELRELLRQARSDRQVEEYDPLTQLPKGFSKLNKAAIVAECELRGITVTKCSGRKNDTKWHRQAS